jgi:tRNA G18 (ribose-2'-O)-methylase SpoU
MAPNKLRPSPKWGDSVAPKQTHRDDFLAQQRRPITGVLDGVTQNYNIGAIFRLRDAFRVQALILPDAPNTHQRRSVGRCGPVGF